MQSNNATMTDCYTHRDAMRCIVMTCLLVLSPATQAADFNYSGFGSITAGRTFGSCTPDNTMSDAYNSTCTRFIADWAHAGVYSPSWSLQPESKLGIQGTLAFNKSISATAQVVARMADGTKADLEWAYLTYDIDPAWTLQLGRKRLPLYYYSLSQDVGYSYPWLRLPPDIYGWDAVNYNGVNATYRKVLGTWSLKSNLFAGDETSKNSSYAKLLFNERKDITWSNIIGADLELSKSWLTVRAVYIRSDLEQIDRASGLADIWPSGDSKGKQRIYGLSANIDTDLWLVRSEYSVFDRGDFQYTSHAWMLGAGLQLGKFTPMLTASSYFESTHFPDGYTPVNWNTLSLSGRYDLTMSSAIKCQLDRFNDGPNTFAGSAIVFSLSYDFVF